MNCKDCEWKIPWDPDQPAEDFDFCYHSKAPDGYGTVLYIDIGEDCPKWCPLNEKLSKSEDINEVNEKIQLEMLIHVWDRAIIHNKFDVREKRKTLNNTAMHWKKLLKKNGRIIIEFYPESEDLDLFISSFTENGFDGFMVKKNPKQKSGQIFLLLKKKTDVENGKM